MYKRQKWSMIAAVCALVSLGAGMAGISAAAQQSLTGFSVSSVSVRVSDETQNDYNTSGIRFKTDVGANAKETYKDAACYTTVTIEDYGVARNVAAQVWREDNSGWNTVVMGIPQSDYATKITAQSFIKVSESVVYATEAVSYSISDAAELVLQDPNASAETKAAVEKYIVRENGTTASYQADLNTINNGNSNTSYGTYSTTNGWKATNSAILQGGSNDSNPTHKSLFGTDATVFGVCLNGKSSAKGKLVSPTLEEGISKLSFAYGFPFQDNQFGMTVSIKVGGTVVVSKTLEQTGWTKYSKSTFVWELDEPVLGDFTIEFANNAKGGATKNGERVTIWNIVWDNYVEGASSGGNQGGNQGGDDSGNDGDNGGDNGGSNSGNEGGDNGGNGGSQGGGTTSGTGAHSVGTDGKCTVCGEKLIAYNTSGTYLANWGTREETATFLTPYATAFYTGNYTYENLSKLSGGSSQSTAPNSALYSTLQTLMSSKHKTITSYEATKQMYCYTDCVENDYAHISSFYSGKQLTGAWDGAATWNREHTWPNSKGLGGRDEDDIMMLRPTWVKENSSRGNTAYGEGSSYYHPNSESGGQYDLRGDCARIVLYVYVRWGNTQYMWGTSGVMESMSVLLKWMQEDPVDTWELARNDVVEDITGTRNVFVDYPELAWQLFGQSMPAGVSTPSSANACSGGSSTSSVAAVQIYFPNLQDDGDCALIKVGNTEVLVDAGATRGSAATIVPYIQEYCTDGVLEYVIATHAHEDHIAAFVGSKGTDGVFNNFVCKTIIDFPNASSSSTIYSDYKTWRDKEVSAGAVHYTALDCWNNANGAKRSYELGAGVTMHILYQKYYEQKASKENNHSVCMMISQGDNHYLFTGDLESDGEASLVASNDLPKMAFYKAGHHGSDTSSSATLIDVIQPKVVVATCAAGYTSYYFPKQAFINNVAKYTDKVYVPSYWNGSSILDLNGNICVSSTDGKTLQVNCSNNNTLFKDTAWFKSNRTTPSVWAA